MIKPFWFKRIPNYGDILTPFILDQLRIDFRCGNRHNFNALLVGSIASLARPNVDIFGSGFIRQSDVACKDANWHFVRGPITRQMVLDAGGGCPEIYGDLALLMPEFVEPATIEHDVGYIPHHVEYDLFPNDEFKILLENTNVRRTTLDITKCRKVISSSLHGIIVAHSYGIPAAYVSMSDKLSGDGMKFTDYYRSVGLEPVLSTIEEPVFQLPGDIDMSEPLRIMKELA